MAGYLSRLQITLDEEDALLQDDGTIVDGIGTNEPVSTVIEVGTAISAQDADDEIQEEAVSIESDLEAMQEGVDAVTELKEQNDVHQELLEQPEIISPEVAVTTQDAFVITLAKLKITPEMAFQSRLSLDSCAKDPVRIVRVTHDGVKEFLLRIKEHIMAFFRTVKKKVMKLIASLAVYFSASIEKVDALIKKCDKGKLKDNKFDLKNKDIARKFFELVPYTALPIIASGGGYDISKYFRMLGDKFKGSSTNHLEKLKDIIIKVLSMYVERQGTSDTYVKELAKELTDGIAKVKDALATGTTSPGFLLEWKEYLDAYEQKYIQGELKTKEDYEYTEPFVASLPAGNAISIYRIGFNTEANNEIPEFFNYKASLTQTGIDKAVELLSSSNNSVYNGSMVSDLLEDLRGGIKQVDGYCKGMYKHLEDGEKEITNIISKLEKDADDEYKDGSLIKLVSQTQMILAKATFENVMSISKVIKTILAVGNLAVDSIKDTIKEDKREAKRGGTDLVRDKNVANGSKALSYFQNSEKTKEDLK